MQTQNSNNYTQRKFRASIVKWAYKHGGDNYDTKKVLKALVNFMPEFNIGVNISDDFGMTPLHQACLINSKELVMLLIAKKANVNAKDKSERTPLHHAQTFPVIALLLKAGADVNVVDVQKNTPLHYACELQIKKGIVMLLKRGALSNTKNANEKTPLDIACNKERFDIAKVLIKYGARMHNTRNCDNRLQQVVQELAQELHGKERSLLSHIPDLRMAYNMHGKMKVNTNLRNLRINYFKALQ
jgi:ankyrin repeat protein